MRVASVGCFPGHGGDLDIFKSPVCTCNQAWTFSLSVSHCVAFLSKRSGWRMPSAERSALYPLPSCPYLSNQGCGARAFFFCYDPFNPFIMLAVLFSLPL